MIPSINVNLNASCSCGPRMLRCAPGPYASHFTACPATPVLIPCRIPRTHGPMTIQHPTLGEVEVVLTISGDTWETSTLAAVDLVWRDGARVPAGGEWPTQADCDAAHDAVAPFWSLIKALVTGQKHDLRIRFKTWCGLVDQRDAVFAALSDMARAEDAAADAQTRVNGSGIAHRLLWRGPLHHLRDAPGHQSPSAAALESYVEHLCEQVQVLP